MFKKVRVFLLIFILILVATVQWKTQARLIEWSEPVWVVIYPIAADSSPNTDDYIQALNVEQLISIENFMKREAEHYGIQSERPIKLSIANPVNQMPPTAPGNDSPLKVMLWSLQLRYWAWNNEEKSRAGDVSLFVLYHDPALLPSVPHSLGLEKGHIGVIHAFAQRNMTQSNNVIITHELLHTLGATDKYNLETTLPIFPDGYAEPELDPLYPQQIAEIMGGRIPITAQQANIPRHMNETLIGGVTAQEIGW